MKEVSSLFSELNQMLGWRPVDLSSVKSCVIDCGFPNHDKRGTRGVANDIEEYCVSEFPELKGFEENYSAIMNWILSTEDLDSIKLVLSRIVDDFEGLYHWKTPTPKASRYELYAFDGMSPVPNVLSENDFVYYKDILQLTDKLLVLQKLDLDIHYLYDYRGHLLNDVIHVFLMENYEDEYFGGHFRISLGPNDFILLEEWGNSYYNPTIRYLLRYSHEMQMIHSAEIVADDFLFDSKDAQDMGSQIARLFINQGKEK